MFRRNSKSAGLIVTVALLAAAATAAATPDAARAQDPSVAVARHYLAIQSALAGDSLDQVPDHATAIRRLTAVADAPTAGAGSGAPADAPPRIADAAAVLARAETLDAARAAFATLSEALIHDRDVIAAGQLKVAYCPMAGEHWLQTGDRIANPYYGAAMLRCGKFEKQDQEDPESR